MSDPVKTKQLRYFAELMDEFSIIRLKVGDVEIVRNPTAAPAQPQKPTTEFRKSRSVEQAALADPSFEEFQRTGSLPS